MPGSPRSFSLEDLIECYRTGVFPMAEARDDERIFLVDPDERGVIPLEAPHIARRLARTVRSDIFQVRVDTAFSRVIAECARPRPDRRETWINRPIEMMYRDLFAAGLAHSVECWIEDELVGGLYGVALNGAFFGESMFSVERDASKVALVHLIGRLRYGGYRLLDTQFITEHLTQFGAVQIPRATYRVLLKDAVRVDADFYRLPGFTGEAVLQAISHTS